MKNLLDKLEALPSCDAEELQYMRKPGRVVFLSELRSIINEAKEESQEPFGYFKAEPFGWTDCAETDEGAKALYEYPADDVVRDAERYRWLVENRLLKGMNLRADSTSEYFASGFIGRGRSIDAVIDAAMKGEK